MLTAFSAETPLMIPTYYLGTYDTSARLTGQLLSLYIYM